MKKAFSFILSVTMVFLMVAFCYAETTTHVHPVCGNKCSCGSDSHNNINWMVWDGSTKPNNGYYNLDNDITLDGDIIIKNVKSDIVAEKYNLAGENTQWVYLEHINNNLVLHDQPHGTWGSNVSWKLIENTLIISGTGEIESTSSGTKYPWGQYVDDITKIIVQSGITSIPQYTFEYCESATDIILPETLTSINLRAFNDCGSLNNLLLPFSIKSVTGNTTSFDSEIVMPRCESLTDMYYVGTYEEWNTATNGKTVTNLSSEMTIHFLQLHEILPTCTQAGTQAYYQFDDSSVYDELYDENRNVISQPEPIPATGHKDENNDGKCDNCGITLLRITKHPASATGELNKGVNFKVEAVGEGALSYRWQKSTDGGETWADLAGKTADTLTATAGLANDGAQYRCVVTDANGSVTSNAATLRTAQVNITKQPGGRIGQLNKNVTYEVAVTGENVSLQWQKSTDGGKTWNDLAGKSNAKLVALASNANHGAYYRCKVTDKNGLSVYSSAAVLKTAQVNITKQPGGRIGQLNKNVNYEVTVTGENVTFLWQKSTDGGKTWKDLAGYTNAKLTALASLANNGAYYRCKVTDKNGLSVYSSSAILRVAQLNITAQPKSVSAAAGTKATFSVTVTGDNVGYQWQKSTDGGKTWANLTGYTKSAFTITLRADHNGVRYRCVLTDKAGVSVNSNTAVVTVK